MRITGEHNYHNYCMRLLDIVEGLNKNTKIPKLCFQMVIDYFEAADPVQGRPQSGPWKSVEVRHGYRNDIPGLISEIITMCQLPDVMCYKETITAPQDEHTQRNLKIDIIAKDVVDNFVDITFQVKTVCFDGHSVRLEPSFFEGFAQYLSLVDIDDRECYICDREKLKNWSKQNGDKITYRQLQQLPYCRFYDLKSQYKTYG